VREVFLAYHRNQSLIQFLQLLNTKKTCSVFLSNFFKIYTLLRTQTLRWLILWWENAPDIAGCVQLTQHTKINSIGWKRHDENAHYRTRSRLDSNRRTYSFFPLRSHIKWNTCFRWIELFTPPTYKSSTQEGKQKPLVLIKKCVQWQFHCLFIKEDDMECESSRSIF